MIQQQIYQSIRKNFARFLNKFIETNRIYEESFRNCTNEIIEITKQAPKTVRYELMGKDKGLYTKEIKDFHNPCYVVQVWHH